jgi:diaminopimelate epimerase
MGNPHAIVIGSPLIESLVRTLEKDQHFLEGVNVGAMDIKNRGEITLNTWERGVGPTLACGSNTCAAVAVGIKAGFLDSTVTVHVALGKLQITWENLDAPIKMAGPSTRVFDGVLRI